MPKEHDKQFKLDAVQYYQDHKDLGVRGCAENLGIEFTVIATLCYQMNSSEYIKKERPFSLEVFRHTGHISGGILTVRHSQAAVCHFRITKKRRIATTLLSCSEDGARERYSIICYAFSFCWQPLYQWQRRR